MPISVDSSEVWVKVSAVSDKSREDLASFFEFLKAWIFYNSVSDTQYEIKRTSHMRYSSLVVILVVRLLTNLQFSLMSNITLVSLHAAHGSGKYQKSWEDVINELNSLMNGSVNLAYVGNGIHFVSTCLALDAK